MSETQEEKEIRLKKMREELIANRPDLPPPKPRSVKPPKGRGCIR